MPASRRRNFLITSACLVLALFALILVLPLPTVNAAPEAQELSWLINGQLLSPQGQPIEAATISAIVPGAEEPLAETESQEDGGWVLRLDQLDGNPPTIEIAHAHYVDQSLRVDADSYERLIQSGGLSLGEQVLERQITPGFWAATIIFVAVLLLIAFEKLHNTTAALAGLSAVFLVTYVFDNLWPGYYIFSFERALTYINWEVIFLVMGMMIVIAVIERTGIFQWMAFQAYRLSRGRTWLLVLILMLITAVASALLDNFTTMLLMAPISLQIGLALSIDPLALIIPEIMASNVGGISTLIGTPTNILIGAYANIGFSDFLLDQTPGVVAALILMGAYVLYHYRHEWSKHAGGISTTLYERLETNGRIRDPHALSISGIVFVLILAGFVVGESYHVVPAVPALIGATLLLLWLKPDVHAMIQAVDWTTLVFFMALFIVVGAIQEVGLLGFVAQWMADVIGGNLPLGILVMVFGVGIFSIAVANIPLAASFLPIAEFLSGSIPGAGKALYYALSMGTAMGGNGFLISAEANLVTAGITRQADNPISFAEFMKVGLPVTFLTLLAGFLWLLIRF
ncbi:MAG TPA: ArsB/NhaD family transporter [Anaerolineales bacterium]